MARPSLVASLAAAALLAAMTGAAATVHTFDKLTYLTFSQPVQIPGVTLDAGTYRFHLADPSTGRSVVQVLSNDGAVVYAMFHTIPDMRETPTDEATVTFREVPVGVAPPVKTLYYGGETRGYEFLYPRGGPNMVPNLTVQPPITYAPIVAEVKPVAEPELAPLVAAPVIVPEPVVEPAALPVTASPVPLVAFGGAASLLLGLGVALFRRHVA